jgi:hypothetical protein
MEIKELTPRHGPPQIFKAIRVYWYPDQRPIGYIRYLRTVSREYGPETTDALDAAILDSLGALFFGAQIVVSRVLLANEQYEALLIQTRGGANHSMIINFYDQLAASKERWSGPIQVVPVKFTLAHWLMNGDERLNHLPPGTLVAVDADLGQVLKSLVAIH